MPIYEYTCRECGFEFEELIRNSAQEQQLTCGECGSDKVERRMSVPAAPQANSAPSAACQVPLPVGCGNCGTDQACQFPG